MPDVPDLKMSSSLEHAHKLSGLRLAFLLLGGICGYWSIR